MKPVKIGVLALQGAITEHIRLLERLEAVEGCAVRYLDEINTCDGLIIPGGESTAIGRLLRDFHLLEPLREKILSGFPVWGTCAGMILLAKRIENDSAVHLGVMDVTVCRNAYGRQMDSFQTAVRVPEVSDGEIPLVFIRAPYVTQCSPEVKVLLRVQEHIVACRQESMLATSFHPELTGNLSFHQYFTDMVRSSV
jgi:5'-phosphate synthase pdxT subunit